MRTRNVLLSVLVGLGIASCGENPPPATTDKPALTNPKPYGEAPPVQGTPQVASATPVASPISVSNAQFTISCDVIDGPAHVAEAELRKRQLMEASHMPDWYAIHSETRSEIFYGHYGAGADGVRGATAVGNSAEKHRQEADRSRISALLDRLGNPMVRGVMLTPIVQADPVAPAEWNLLNTPKDAFWTIEFATFVDGPDLVNRKQAAVELVRHYREELHRTDVYYYHGPTVSSVCVGAWKREAMAEQGTRTDAKGQMRDDGGTQSADQALFVMNDIVPGNMPARVIDQSTGKAMAVQALKREVVDPDMKAAMVEFHDHWENMRKKGQDENGTFVANPSMFVQIPHDQAPMVVTDENWRLSGGQGAAPVQQQRPTAGDDVLRSIGSH